MMRHAFGHAAGIHENESRSVLLNQLSQSRINFFPNFVRHHRFKRRFRNFDRQIELAAVTHGRVDQRGEPERFRGDRVGVAASGRTSGFDPYSTTAHEALSRHH